jgi:5'(3')-deoxyribonucleotidase
MTVLVDVDNVLEDLNSAWVDAVNKKYGTSVSPEDIASWDIEKYFNGLSRTQVFSPLHDENFWKSLEPIDGSQVYLKKLIDDGYKVLLVTSSHPDTIQYKYKFIIKHFPYISFKDIIFTSRKQMVRGDVMIDDAPHNLEGGEYLGLLMCSPHNKGYNAEKQGFIRVSNWEQIYNTIKSIVI